MENRDERYTLVPTSKDDSSLSYTLYSKSKSKVKRSDAPSADEPSSDVDPKYGRVLASRLTSKDIKFVKDGMYVWLDLDTAPPGSEEVLRSGGDMDANMQEKEKRRPGWFCRINRWRCETA
ncbi:hypothetical protein FRC03_011309 [Tulasnella sp. 419]|nr:hypothetical protein FRC03_011309 [Tulasnella sp. 419]